MQYNCKQCKKEFDNYNSLRKHTSRSHKIKSQDFYVEFYLDGKYPSCNCGCGENTNWIGHGFRGYKQGHISRIRNNWGHNKKAIANSAETRRQQYKNGERTVWNDGLAKETDERVKLQGKTCSKSFTDERRERYSTIMRENRLNGVIPTLSGSRHPRWKGGTSSISNIIYASNKLYKEWKYPILKRDDFSCVQCQSTDGLHVHHNKEPLSEIITRFNSDAPDNFEIKKMIADEVIDYHIQSDVSGITLCEDCHKEKHPSLNFQ